MFTWFRDLFLAQWYSTANRQWRSVKQYPSGHHKWLLFCEQQDLNAVDRYRWVVDIEYHMRYDAVFSVYPPWW